MTTIKLLIAALAVAAGLFLLVTYEESRLDRARMESTIATQQQILQAAQSREKSRDAALTTTINQIQAQTRATKTPTQIIAAIQSALNLPAPITLNTQAANPTKTQAKGQGTAKKQSPAISTYKPSVQNLGPAETSAPSLAHEAIPSSPTPQPSETQPPPTTSEITTPEGSATIPANDLQPLFTYIQTCRLCQAQLQTTQSDLADEKQKNTALTTQLKSAETAAKGGTLKHRIRNNAKWLLIGAAIAAAITHTQ